MSGSAASAVMSACETTYATHRPSGESCGSDTAFRAITSSKVIRLEDCARAGSTAKKNIAAMAKRETERRGRIGEDRGSKMEAGGRKPEDVTPENISASRHGRERITQRWGAKAKCRRQHPVGISCLCARTWLGRSCDYLLETARSGLASDSETGSMP